MEQKKVGIVTHFYDKISVAVLSLTENLKVGDKIKFVRGGEDQFEQTVNSMQLEHETVDEATPGQEVAIQVEQKVRAGAEVFRV